MGYHGHKYSVHYFQNMMNVPMLKNMDVNMIASTLWEDTNVSA